MRVRAYRNLRTGGYSLLGRDGRVVAHVNYATLTDVRFVVRPAGRARVLQGEPKNVHAFACGTWYPDGVSHSKRLRDLSEAAGSVITYDPRYSSWNEDLPEAVRSKGWFRCLEEPRWPVVGADLVLLTPYGLRATGVSFFGDDTLPF